MQEVLTAHAACIQRAVGGPNGREQTDAVRLLRQLGRYAADAEPWPGAGN